MDYTLYYICLFIAGIIAFAVLIIVTNRGDKKADQERAEFLKTEGPSWAVDNWRARAKKLDVDISTPIVYMYHANGEFYPVHVWRDGDYLKVFLAKPTQKMCEDMSDTFRYPENLFISSLKFVKCYRQGTEGSYIERDTTRAGIKAMKAQASDGLDSIKYSLQAQRELMYAPSHTVTYDNRKTIVQGEREAFAFRIDAYETIITLFPEE